MTARHTQHWHGTRSVAGPVDAGGCCAGEAGWGLSVAEPAPGATNATRTTRETTEPEGDA